MNNTQTSSPQIVKTGKVCKKLDAGVVKNDKKSVEVGLFLSKFLVQLSLLNFTNAVKVEKKQVLKLVLFLENFSFS